jgi:hypothetical protein
MTTWIKNKDWLNGKSYITIEELEGEYWYIMSKICDILFSNNYYIDTINVARSILDFSLDHQYITWKQANMILKIQTTEERRRLYSSHSSTSRRYIYPCTNRTDRDRDKLSQQLFGNEVFPEELEGYSRAYRDDGSRYWALPTGNERLCDYI